MLMDKAYQDLHALWKGKLKVVQGDKVKSLHPLWSLFTDKVVLTPKELNIYSRGVLKNRKYKQAFSLKISEINGLVWKKRISTNEGLGLSGITILDITFLGLGLKQDRGTIVWLLIHNNQAFRSVSNFLKTLANLRPDLQDDRDFDLFFQDSNKYSDKLDKIVFYKRIQSGLILLSSLFIIFIMISSLRQQTLAIPLFIILFLVYLVNEKVLALASFKKSSAVGRVLSLIYAFLVLFSPFSLLVKVVLLFLFPVVVWRILPKKWQR